MSGFCTLERCEYRFQTAMAVKVEFEDSVIWIPKSLVQNVEDHEWEEFEVGE